MADSGWQETMTAKLADALAAAQNGDYDEAAMWANAALEAREGADRG